MIIDTLVSIAANVLSSLVSWLFPQISVTLPGVDFSGFTSALDMVNQIIPLEVLTSVVLWMFGALGVALIWRAGVFVWEHLPVLGHGAV